MCAHGKTKKYANETHTPYQRPKKMELDGIVVDDEGCNAIDECINGGAYAGGDDSSISSVRFG